MKRRDDLSTAKVNFTSDIDSISTKNEQRDAHLKAGDFFDAENHPKLTFVNSKLQKIDDENYKLYGTPLPGELVKKKYWM